MTAVARDRPRAADLCESDFPTTRSGTAGGATWIFERVPSASCRRAPAARGTDIDELLCRDRDESEYRLMLDDEGDVDRELIVAFDEFTRAVERVHHP